MSILKTLFNAVKAGGGEAAVRQLLRNTPPQVRQRAQQTLQRAVGGSSGRQLPPTNIRPSAPAPTAPRGSLTVSPVPKEDSITQLSLLRGGKGTGIVKLRNPAGTVDPATGRGMGGQVFDPNVPVVPRQGPGLSSGYIPTRGGGPMKIGPVQDLSLDEAIQRGLVKVNVPAQAAVRNAVGGTRKMNLAQLAGLIGIGSTGGFGISAALYNMLGGGGASNADQPNNPLPSDLRGISTSNPLLEAERADRIPVTQPGSVTGGIPGQTGPAVIRTDDAASAQRQATANAIAATLLRPDSPGAYSNVGGYYQARNAYAAQPGVVGNIVEQLIQVDPRFDRPELQAWAEAYPGLAYEMLNNQQMPNLQQPEITTELGSNTPNNAIGNSEEQARVVLEGADPALRDATRPRMAVSLQNPFYARPGFAATGRI